jgi:hypothetical protein
MREQTYIPYPISIEQDAVETNPAPISIGVQHLLPACLTMSPEWDIPDAAAQEQESTPDGAQTLCASGHQRSG